MAELGEGAPVLCIEASLIHLTREETVSEPSEAGTSTPTVKDPRYQSRPLRSQRLAREHQVRGGERVAVQKAEEPQAGKGKLRFPEEEGSRPLGGDGAWGPPGGGTGHVLLKARLNSGGSHKRSGTFPSFLSFFSAF